MPAPATTDELFALVERSRLLSAPVLGRYRSGAAALRTPEQAADWMVRDGVLTPFQASMLMAGKTRPFFVGPYKVLSRIGNGSMGVVYLCEHVNMRRKVAVKVLQGRRTKDEVAVQRFLREARAAGTLDHPNVVRALDLGREGEMYYLSMEYVDGASLTEVVRAEGPLAPLRLAEYLRQAAFGLQHAHACGLIHRDIRPSNVMVGRDGVVKLLDLGLALFADGVENLTQGAPVGSLGYIAPEQALDAHAVDVRADIFSLGATIYFGMTGHAPNPAREIGDVLAPEGCNAADFASLVSIVQRMMAPAVEDRFQTAVDVLAAVAQWVPPPAPRRAPAKPSAVAPGAGAPADSIFDPLSDPSPAEPASFAQAGAPLAVPARPTPQPRSRTTAASKAAWTVRYRWPLVLALAVLVGLGASFATRSNRSAPDPQLKSDPAPVNPTAP